MATMISEVYDAFVEAGASQEKSRRAAEAVANYETRFAAIDQKLTTMQGDLNLLKWMVGVLIAAAAAIFVKSLTS